MAYESNLYNREGGDGDSVLSGRPNLRLERVASATKLEVIAEVAAHKYLDFSEEDSVDPSISISYAYPQTEEALPTREATIGWSRSSEPDADVGQRIQRTELAGRYEGTIYDTGKTTVDAILGAGTQDYSRYDGQSTSGNVGLAVGYLPRGLLKYALGYDYSSSTYETSGVPGSKVSRRGHDLSARVRGELSSKISGRISLGVTRGDYGGALDFSKTDFTLGAQLDWQQTERRRFALGASRAPYFTSDGQAAANTSLNVSLSQEMSGGFSVNLRGRATAVDSQGSGTTNYDVLGSGVSLYYNRTGLLGGELGVNADRYSSSQASRNFSRYTVFARVAYRF